MINMHISNLFNMFPNVVKNFILKSVVSPFLLMNKDGVDNMIGIEMTTRGSSANRQTRLSLANQFPLEHFIRNGNLSVIPVTFLLSAIIAFTPELRDKFSTSYGGRIPIITSLILSQARTGTLAASNDQVANLEVNKEYQQWLFSNKLENSILDINWMLQGSNYERSFSFLSSVSNSGYLPTCNWLHFNLKSDQTITLTGLNYNAEENTIQAHPGSSFPKNEGITLDSVVLALLLHVRLVDFQNIGYVFAGSDRAKRNSLSAFGQHQLLINACIQIEYNDGNQQVSETRAQQIPESVPAVATQYTPGQNTGQVQNMVGSTSTGFRQARSPNRGPKPPQAYVNYPGYYQDREQSISFMKELHTLFRKYIKEV